MGGAKATVKSFEIRKRLVFEAWKKVRSKGGAPGVDAVSTTVFESREGDLLYKLWNRMSAGSYMPSPVRAVEIPKDHGEGVRVLGVPTVADRVAQTAAAMLLGEKLEPIFHPDSYGYRPGRNAHDALAAARRRCWAKAWVLDLDIRAFFDSVPHDLLLKAVAHHTQERWVLLYIERWLKAPMQMPDGTLVARERGTPQGSPISPLLANAFMHYAFGVPRSCVELAGESPVMVMTKQPCSWWAMEGETRLSKPHDKVACLGGEQAYGPYDEESCVSVVIVPAKADQCGSRAPRTRAKRSLSSPVRRFVCEFSERPPSRRRAC
jgi:reverse transcriptase-like protein